ncbi:DALR anticodon-binding domain-containing protein [Lentzea rhizosphaerae]|uniref:arginine--tRNA ligase n=1 Tax=Lentzea rhizosphaerae TaxID=2041025 RepID=A0ABV8C876_9PSEU
MLLDDLSDVLTRVAELGGPHRLCQYLFSVASAFTAFYERCPVLKAPSPAVMANRLLLCRLTARTLQVGVGLLGIATPDRL